MRQLALSMLLAGCSESSMNGKVAMDGAPADEHDTDARISLRVDVFPSQLRDADETDAFRVLPQTVQAQDLLVQDVSLAPIALTRPQRQTGTVSAYRVNPAVATLPGEVVPVEGTVWIRDPNSVQSYAATTTADGAFDAWVVPNGEYRLEVVPDDPLLPIFSAALSIGDRPVVQDIDLGSGAPIYGFVTSAGNTPMPGAKVHVVDPEGATSATAYADENGLYQVRVTPGTWTVVCEGRSVDQDPVLTMPPITVGPGGVNLDIPYPTDLERVLVQGRVVDPDGNVVPGTVVRFVATELDGYADAYAPWETASWVTEPPVGADTTFLGYVVPGTYTVEVLPPSADAGAEDFSPIRLPAQRITSDVQLDVLTLEPLRTVEGTVRAGNRELAGAQITCSEIGFDERFWTVFSDDDGAFTVDLPRVPVACEILPPGDEPELATRWLEHDPESRDALNVELVPGQAVTGSVETVDGPEEFAVVEIVDLDGRRIGVGFTDKRGSFDIRVDLEDARVSGLTP